MNLTLLYIDFGIVIPAPYHVRGKLQRESSSKILLPAPAYRQAGVGRGFRVKPGMTNKVIGKSR